MASKQAEVILFPKEASSPKQLGKWHDSLRADFESYLSEQGLNLTHQRELILETLRKTDGNKTQAAKILGIGVRTLYRKLEEYGEK